MIWILGIILCVIISIMIYMFVEANGNRLLHHTVYAEGTKEQCNVFFISDTHNRKISPKLLSQIKNKVDFVIIGGDFADKRTSDAKIKDNLQALTNLAPTYFVWGNNDIEVGYERLMQHLTSFGVKIVCNDSQIVLNQQNKIRLCATDFNTGIDEAKHSLTNVKSGEHIIYATHSPHDFHYFYSLCTPLLSLAGHVHGGQIRIGPYSRKFPKGHFKQTGSHYELISNGYGTTLVPFRLFAKPQAHFITIQFQ